MGTCQYRFNPSEMYQRSQPGMGVETSCGARTYAAIDDPELAPLTGLDGTVQWKLTGRMMPRSHDDPYCPGHGGTPEPPEPPVTQAELQAAHDQFAELAARFQRQSGLVPSVAAAELASEAPGQLPAAAQVYQTATGTLPVPEQAGGM